MRYFEMQIGKEGALMRGYLHEKSESWYAREADMDFYLTARWTR